MYQIQHYTFKAQLVLKVDYCGIQKLKTCRHGKAMGMQAPFHLPTFWHDLAKSWIRNVAYSKITHKPETEKCSIDRRKPKLMHFLHYFSLDMSGDYPIALSLRFGGH